MPMLLWAVPSHSTGTLKANGTPPSSQIARAARAPVPGSITWAGWSGEPPMIAIRGAFSSSRS